MIVEFKLPELGENIETADISKVAVKKGDTIKVDQTIVEIETDKATVEVPSDQEGVVSEVLVKDGDNVKVGAVLIKIETSGGEHKEKKEENKETDKDKTPEPEKEEKPEPKKEEKTETVREKSAKTSTAKSGTYEFKLPELGEGIETADVTKVLVKKGDSVNVDDSVIEIETDKATVEVPIDTAGIVKEVKIKDGKKAKVGETIIILETTSETTTTNEDESAEVKHVEETTEEKTEPAAASEVKQSEIISPQKEKIISQFRSAMPEKIAPASPSVRRFAREIGIDIHEVSGSGPGGRISVEDVKKFAKTLNEKISSQSGGGIGIKQEALPDFSKWGSIRREPMNNIRRKTAEHLSYAWATVPHVTQFDKADITELEKARKAFSKTVEKAGGKLTVTAILVKVIASALKAFPNFNTSIDLQNNEIIYKDYYNVGIAVDTDRGLIVPVIKDADKKNITKLAVELSEISEKARNKKTTIEEMQGGNFSISNLGGIGGTGFSPIVNTPEVAILGVSRASYQPVYMDGEFVPRLIMPLSLSYDHRIIDGADGARFLRWVCSALEQPLLLALEG
ncbi:MAG: dihydrolipoyllysine-residue acetyltransferase [Melioribacteraceae bacterium]|nr:dihydrolipoyllysine-residue acetyltransferase [Melioribacteraceae bacterium]